MPLIVPIFNCYSPKLNSVPNRIVSGDRKSLNSKEQKMEVDIWKTPCSLSVLAGLSQLQLSDPDTSTGES